MDKQSIWELITNQLPDSKKSKVWEEINASPRLTEQYHEMKKVWALSGFEEIFTAQNIDNKFKAFNKMYRVGNRTSNWVKEILKYTAIIAITLGSSYFLWQSVDKSEGEGLSVSHIASEQGSVNSFTLADGSQIWLNSGSEIRFQSQTREKVELKLTGEALFNVIHNENRQFIVNIGGLQVKDLGTRFNLRNYSEDTDVLATLIEGEIVVSNTAHDFTEQLKPGQQLRYNKTNGSYLLETVDTVYVGDWKEDKFKFVDKTLKDIAVDLENWYGVKIQFKNDKIGEEHFTGVIQKSLSVEQVIKILSYSAGVKYSINEKNNQKKIIFK